ncbi:EI24 domain-containing protein [Desulfogranum mediterraneum]|uniref:EI24 domain-containing protein n=1 Tax=Desulfogranum mediterraneum TaxID=160661 RepID=UPI0004031C82|nr:EI24 domain-containing protein [Desulfogranum mediterraneum]
MHTCSASSPPARPPWVSLGYAAKFIFRYPKLITLSLLLIASTGILTWVGAYGSLNLIDSLVGEFFAQPPETSHFWQWPLFWGWTGIRWLFLIVSRLIAFYLAFLLAYCLTTPGYVFLSYLAANRFTGQARDGEATMSVSGILVDLLEGIKIGGVGLLATLVALVANFIPVVGQAAVFLIYVFYSALMFIDFPASRYRWKLGRKLSWVRLHRSQAFQLGLLPAVISMIPVFNVFFMALLFPLFTVHTTLNYLSIEGRCS